MTCFFTRANSIRTLCQRVDIFLRFFTRDRNRWIPAGFMMALSAGGAGTMCSPWMTMLYSTPRIAFAPGAYCSGSALARGAESHRSFFSVVCFPILINSFYGMRVVNRELRRAWRVHFVYARGHIFKNSLARLRAVHFGRRSVSRGPRLDRRRHRGVVRCNGGFRLSDFFRRPDVQHSHAVRRHHRLCGVGDP